MRNFICSLLDGLDATLPKIFEMIVHRLELVRRVTHPIRYFAEYAQWAASPVRLCGVSRKPLVREVGIILDRAGGIDDVDAPPPFPDRQFGAPGGRFER